MRRSHPILLLMFALFGIFTVIGTPILVQSLGRPRALLVYIPVSAVFLCIVFFFVVRIGVNFHREMRRIENEEIEQFKARAKITDEQFLKDLGVETSSEVAPKVLAIRAQLAALGGIPDESLRLSDHFTGELAKLPFYDSMDVLDLIFRLEKEFGVTINVEDIGETIGRGTVASYLSIGIRKRQQNREAPPAR